MCPGIGGRPEVGRKVFFQLARGLRGGGSGYSWPGVRGHWAGLGPQEPTAQRGYPGAPPTPETGMPILDSRAGSLRAYLHVHKPRRREAAMDRSELGSKLPS